MKQQFRHKREPMLVPFRPDCGSESDYVYNNFFCNLFIFCMVLIILHTFFFKLISLCIIRFFDFD